MNVLITGGLGFIGSHIAVELLENNDEVIIIDNLSNSKITVVDKIKEITGKDVKTYIGNCEDEDFMSKIFNENKIDNVIHCAGLKAVGESVDKPLLYYKTNIGATFTLLNVMRNHNVKKLIFSSTATVYGIPETVPIDESFEVRKDYKSICYVQIYN